MNQNILYMVASLQYFHSYNLWNLFQKVFEKIRIPSYPFMFRYKNIIASCSKPFWVLFLSGFLFVLIILQVLHRVVQVLSILTTRKGKVSNMGVIDQHSLDHHSRHSRGLMDMTR